MGAPKNLRGCSPPLETWNEGGESGPLRRHFLLESTLLQSQLLQNFKGLGWKSSAEINHDTTTMTLDDPFIVVKEEVCKALCRTRELFQHWTDNCQGSNEVSEWVASQLRNGLRSLEWDLDDLEATLAIAKRQGLRDNKEISSRLNFIIKTRQEIQNIKDELNLKREDWDRSARQPETPKVVVSGTNKTKYRKLESDSPEKVVVVSSPNSLFVECDENALMLEDFGQEVELLGGDDGKSSYFWTKLRYVPLGKRVWIIILALLIAFICSLTSLVLVFGYRK